VELSDDPCFGLKMAEQYITDSRIALQEISSLLGFSELSAFSRAFRRWTGQPPSAARDAAA
jgi:AraC-like DNA-binding protein